jgi:hypothetical protein
MGDGEVVELLEVELLEIAIEHLPRARFEYDRLGAELNSLKAEISNSVRIYQRFCDRNLELKKEKISSNLLLEN